MRPERLRICYINFRTGHSPLVMKCWRNPMAKTQYMTQPPRTDKMPPGVPYIVGNEAAERFSYYGMNSILVVFMTHHLLMPHDQADGWYHIFVSCAYFL